MAFALKSPFGHVVYVESEDRMTTLVNDRGYELVNEDEPSKGVAATDEYDAEKHDADVIAQPAEACPECGSTDHTEHPKTRRSKKSDESTD